MLQQFLIFLAQYKEESDGSRTLHSTVSVVDSILFKILYFQMRHHHLCQYTSITSDTE